MTEEMKKHTAEWFARLRSDCITDEERRQHREWLQQSEDNRKAYESIEDEWLKLGNLQPWASDELRYLEEQFAPHKSQQVPGNTAHVKTRKKCWLPIFGWSGLTAALTSLAAFVILLSTGGTDSYQTLEGEQRKIVLDDGSRAHINSASILEVNYTKAEREITLLKGEALFNVAKDSSRPFVVNARNSKVVAIGTSFNVYYNQNNIDITVVEGKVAVLPAKMSGKAIAGQLEVQIAGNEASGVKKLREAGIVVKSNHQIRVNKQGQASEPKVVDATKLTAWERGILILDRMPLRQVVKEISRYVPGDVQVASNVPDYPVTGTIEIRDQNTILRLLSQVVPVIAVRESPQVTRLYAAADKTWDDS